MDRFKGLKIGMQTFTLRNFDFAGVVERVDELGLKYVETAKKHVTAESDEAEISQALDLCAARGITINCAGVGNLVADVDANRPVFEFAKRLGVKYMMANPQPDSMDALDKLVDEYEIKVGIHNHGPTSTWPDIETIDKAIQGHSPLIGLCADTGHFLRVPVDPMDVFNHFGDRVHSIHLKDIEEDKDGEHGQEHIVGDGPLDLKAVLDWLVARDFGGPVSIEYEINPEDPMPDLKIALDRIEQALA